jgi:hypothetical protein
MDKYIYLIGAIVFLIPALIIAYYRPDLRKLAIIAGLCGGIAALITEPIFTRDYWLPPNLLGWERICIEDFFFGAGITAFIALLYPGIMRRQFSEKAVEKKRFGIYAVFNVVVALAMYVGIFVWGINSVVVSAGLCFLLTPVIWILRRDLIRPSLIVTAIVLAFVLVMYLLFFDVIVPDWWDKYWLLKDDWLGVTILGNIPVTELLWYGGWALFASVIWPFSLGLRFEPLQNRSKPEQSI